MNPIRMNLKHMNASWSAQTLPSRFEDQIPRLERLVDSHEAIAENMIEIAAFEREAAEYFMDRLIDARRARERRFQALSRMCRTPVWRYLRGVR